ncbi:hypothetical protein OKJ48_22390 [Streptomyces kunmingensis]|uniref:Uncharacterized protein n=1 Tax=Streptomyces kunmingensis TaxID=68225 RepID=A0ABU6CGF3_9ACTN|nr:hypothetical protein [Streptomyces kunmingensis]MEB3962975.1 hypothetical protein [Streptomyces kunmingensis]
MRQLLNDPRLNDPRLKGSREAVRLAVVILLCKAPAKSAAVEVQSRDFAGWLGCSLSYFAHTVRYWLEETGLATITQVHDNFGYIDRLRFELMPLREARAACAASPLAALGKRELGVLLATAEAVTCPGWSAPRNKPEAGPTLPGFMDFEKKKKGSASIRLAVLLLVLRCRRDGKVPMVAGKVKAGFSRADATLAKIMGWDLKTAARAIERMNRDGVLLLTQGAKGDHHGRMRIAAVSAAYTRLRGHAVVTEGLELSPAQEPVQSRTVCVSCAEHTRPEDEFVPQGEGWAQETFDDALGAEGATAFRNQESLEAPRSLEPLGALGTDDVLGLRASADIHAEHTPVVDLSRSSTGALDRFSGSAGGGAGPLRDGARLEEQHVRSVILGGPERRPGTGVVPLRGENQTGRSQENGSMRLITAERLPVDLQVVLAPVARLWARIPRTSTMRWLAGRVRDALTEVAHVVGPDKAQVVLAERLSRRMSAQEAPVTDVAGWLIGRGLPRNAGCWSPRCDDGLRMDDNQSCESCATRLADRRYRYRQVMSEVTASSPQKRAEVERRVHDAYRRTAENHAMRWEHERGEKAERDVLVARRRHEVQKQRAEAQARPCQSCGRVGVAGECSTCRSDRLTACSVRAAVDLVVALRADLTDLSALEELTRTVEADTWRVVRQQQIVDDEGSADVRRHLADQVLSERRARALARLVQSAPAVREGQLVYRMTLNRPAFRISREELLSAAEQEAERARQRVARELLDEFLADLARIRSRGASATEGTRVAAGR